MRLPMTAVSLFAGVGGFDLALERSGVKVTAAVEIDPSARGVLADRFPGTTLFTDVTKVTADDIRSTGFVPERGILTAGWPCQGNSVAGARGGMADPRSGLWRHVVRLLAELRPAWFFGENVPGLLSVTDGEDFGIVLNDLAELGMGFAYRVMDAQFFGVPQRRRRVFIVGRLGNSGAAPVQVLLEPEGRSGNPPQGKPAGQGVAASIAGGIGGTGVSASVTAKWSKGTGGPSGDEAQNLIVSTIQGGVAGATGSTPNQQQAATSSSREVVMALTSSNGGPDDNMAQAGHLVTHTHTFQKVIRSGERDMNGNLPPEVWAERGIAATLNLNDLGSESRAVELVVQPVAIRGRDEGAQLEVGEVGEPAHSLRASTGGSSHGMVAVSATGPTTHTLTSEGADASEDGTGRGTPVIAFAWQAGGNNDASGAIEEEMSPTLPKSQTMAVQTETSVRRLTPMECERLQGFPDGWTLTSNSKPQADAARYRQMGNSVAVPCIEWIVRRIVAMEEAA